jgi:hypothetical protein
VQSANNNKGWGEHSRHKCVSTPLNLRPRGTACARVYTRRRRPISVHAARERNLQARRKGGVGRVFLSLLCSLHARDLHTLGLCACTNQYTFTHTAMGEKKQVAGAYLVHAIAHGWRRRRRPGGGGAHSHAGPGAGAGASGAGGCITAAADSARHPLLIWGDIHQRRRQLPPASPTQ